MAETVGLFVEHFEIAKSVVVLDPVDVVNFFKRQKRPTEVVFSDYPVFEAIPAIEPDDHIS